MACLTALNRTCRQDLVDHRCIICDPIAAVPAVPAQYGTNALLGWDAGANSIAEHDGDLIARVVVQAGAVGIVTGLRTGRDRNTVPALVEHGWYFRTVDGVSFAGIIEGGEPVTGALAYSSTDQFYIRRAGQQVSYWVNDTIAYVSTVPSTGAKVLNACLYATNDTILEASYEEDASPILVSVVVGRIPPLRGLGAAWTAAVAGRMPSLSAAATVVSFGSVSGRMPPLRGLGAAWVRAVAGRMPPLRAVANGSAPPLAVSGVFGHLAPPKATSTSRSWEKVRLSGTMAPLRAYGGAWAKAVIGRMAPPHGIAIGGPPVTRYVSALMSPGYMTIRFGATSYFNYLADGIKGGDANASQPTFFLGDGMKGADASDTDLTARNIVNDTAAMSDVLSRILSAIAAETAKLGDAALPSLTAIASLVEDVRMLAGVGSTLSAMNAVAEALALRDAMYRTARENLSDGAKLAESFASALAAYHAIVDKAVLADVPGAQAVLRVLLAETVNLGDAMTSTAELRMALSSGLEIGLTFRLNGDTFYAWVLHTESKAFVEYENFPFNSFAELEHKTYYAMADDGLYELSGSDDDGEAIRAHYRTGLIDLGTRKLKRIESMYLAYSATGKLALKVTTTSPDGEKVEWWYALTPRTANVPREGRIKIGRGLKSVFWAFEIANIDGADFAVDTMELYPMILDRRL